MAIKKQTPFSKKYKIKPNLTQRQIIAKTIKNEIGYSKNGGYNNHPDDKGGETKWGISKAQYPDLNIECLTKDEAINIYIKDYWVEFKLIYFPEYLRSQVFDMFVNHSPSAVIKIIQRACNKMNFAIELLVDGIWGKHTLTAILTTALHARPKYTFQNAIVDERRLYYKYLTKIRPENKAFIRGWYRRAEKYRVVI